MAEFILAGHLYDFKEVDGSAIVARLNYEVRLRDRKTGTTVWTHTYSHDEPASEKTVSAVVAAMDKNVQRSVQEVQAGLEEYFRSQPNPIKNSGRINCALHMSAIKVLVRPAKFLLFISGPRLQLLLAYCQVESML